MIVFSRLPTPEQYVNWLVYESSFALTNEHCNNSNIWPFDNGFSMSRNKSILFIYVVVQCKQKELNTV